jgi:hypothetical protein
MYNNLDIGDLVSLSINEDIIGIVTNIKREEHHIWIKWLHREQQPIVYSTRSEHEVTFFRLVGKAQ